MSSPYFGLFCTCKVGCLCHYSYFYISNRLWFSFSQNYVRVVEVWWDEYKDYFYASRPESKALPYGDISELKKFREDHNCKSFKWFMEEIAYDITAHYPLPPKNVEWGEVSISQYLDIRMCIFGLGV